MEMIYLMNGITKGFDLANVFACKEEEELKTSKKRKYEKVFPGEKLGVRRSGRKAG